MLLLLSLGGIILQSYMYISPETYISELLISFLPYSIGANFLLIIISIYKAIYRYKKNHIFLTTIWCIIAIMAGIYNIISISEYTHTYTDIYTQTIHKKSGIQQISSEGLTFLYANIYYKNENFSGLLDSIETYKPDVVLLIEYAKIHDEALSKILKSQYPYVSRYVGGQGYDGDVIYSAYPLKKIKHTVYPGSFSHVSITYNNKNIDFALIHTSAPVSKEFFEMRNRQLNDLSNLMNEYYKETKDQKIILLGDFNVTPRSTYYKSFDNDMTNLGLYDISNHMIQTKYNTMVRYTRCHEDIPIACSHIDHIWSNTSINLEKINIPGSDHDGFVGKI